ncbi:MAG: UvrD-helicase domain-containing protein, partial [Candidatus Izemoplasma sp.]
MNNILENLNEKQKEAVITTDGPVMAIAGAGSGKTSVLTKRIAYLIYEKNVHYQNILALTFTNKAANEMKQRVRDITGINTRDMWISTFHSMCSKILRQHIELLGYKKSFQIIDDDDTLQMVKSVMKKANFDIKLFNPKNVRSYILKMKFDDELVESVEEPLKTILNVVFPIYQKNLFKNNLLDFEDLIILTIKLLKENPQVKEYYQKVFEYVLVDEFQDTNDIQYELIKLLVNKNNNLFIVGDEDQSIYAFRGANIQNIYKFKKDFPGFHLVILEENYRSTNTILKAANQIIKHNSNRIPKNLFSTRGEGELITHYKGVTSRDEVEYVALKVIELVRKGYSYSDFAVLYRANSTSRTFEEVFMQKQIPYKIFGNTSFFKRKEIKDFTAYLRLIVNPEDDYSFVRVVNEPRRGIGAKTLELMANYATDNNLNFMETID